LSPGQGRRGQTRHTGNSRSSPRWRRFGLGRAFATAMGRLRHFHHASIGRAFLLHATQQNVLSHKALKRPQPRHRQLLSLASFFDMSHTQLAEHTRLTLGSAKSPIRRTLALHEYPPDLLGSFLVAHPLVNVSASEAAGDEVVMALADGGADVAVFSDEIKTCRPETFAIRSHRRVMLTPLVHPLALKAQKHGVSILEADACDVIGLPEGSALQQRWEARAALRGLDALVRRAAEGRLAGLAVRRGRAAGS
jgi:LysR substrate binding domain